MKRGHAALLTAAIVAALAALGIWEVRPPAPAGADAPAGAFSAARALDHLRVIAAVPHPLGSPAQARVRRYLLGAFRQAGVEAWTQRAVVTSQHDDHEAGVVHNVLARLPGRERGKAVLLVAHYDSVPVAPGAADDGSSVATLLEVARALRAGPPLTGDVLILLTDGEEEHLLGVRAFLRTTWAEQVGLVLNFDNPGSGGPSVLYETSAGGGRLVEAFRETAPRPFASSLTDELARRRWIESDFSPLQAAGLPGMSFGFTRGFERNHSVLDSVERIDPGSLQHQGDYALALARRFGEGGLGGLHDGDVVAFDLLGGVLVLYPRSWAGPLSVVLAVAYGALLVVGLRRRRLTLSGLLAGAVNGLLALAFTAALVAVTWAIVKSAYGTAGASSLQVYNDDPHSAGLVALVLAIGMAVYLWGLDHARVLDTAAAALLWVLAAALYFSWAFPGMSYLLSWPLAAAMAALAVVFALEPLDRPDGRLAPLPLAVLWMGAAPALLLAGSSLYLLFVASGIKLVVVVISVWLLLALLVPLVDAIAYPRRWPVPAALAAAGVLLFVGLSPATGYGSGWPRTDSLFYRLDASTGDAWWATLDEAPDAWTGRVLGSGDRWLEGHEHFPQWHFRDYHRASAPVFELPAPRLTLVGDEVRGGRRHLRLRLASPRAAPHLSLLLDDAAGEVVAAVEGTAVAGGDSTFPDYSARHWHVDVLGVPGRGVTVFLRVRSGLRLRFTVVDLSPGLPAAAAASIGPRPAGFAQGDQGDATVVSRSYVLGARPGSALRPVVP